MIVVNEVVQELIEIYYMRFTFFWYYCDAYNEQDDLWCRYNYYVLYRYSNPDHIL